MNSNKSDIVFPEWDKIRMCPKEKLPNCPVCEEDELGMMNEDLLICYNCGYEQIRKVMSDKKPTKEEIKKLRELKQKQLDDKKLIKK